MEGETIKVFTVQKKIQRTKKIAKVTKNKKVGKVVETHLPMVVGTWVPTTFPGVFHYWNTPGVPWLKHPYWYYDPILHTKWCSITETLMVFHHWNILKNIDNFPPRVIPIGKENSRPVGQVGSAMMDLNCLEICSFMFIPPALYVGMGHRSWAK